MLNFEKMENMQVKESLNTSCMSLQTTVREGTRYKRAPAGEYVVTNDCEGRAEWVKIHDGDAGDIITGINKL